MPLKKDADVVITKCSQNPKKDSASFLSRKTIFFILTFFGAFCHKNKVTFLKSA
jgi:hypothetical protein